MKRPRYLRSAFRGFGARVYAALIALIFALTVISSIFLLAIQKKMITDDILQGGRTVTELLARNVRLGVFAEYEAQLDDPVNAVMEQKGVLNVVVFNLKGDMLKGVERTGEEKRNILDGGSVREIRDIGMRALKTSPSVGHLEKIDRFVFWAPVLARSWDSEESLFFDREHVPQDKERLIGFVAVSFSKERLREAIRAILLRTVLAGFIFVLFAGVVTYFVVRAVTKPLGLLIDRLKDQGVEAAGKDEVGVLADTYSSMIDRLTDAFNTINDLKEGLEQKVEERTHELADANRELAARKQYLEETNERLTHALSELRETQAQLIHSEKMAALGQMVAGIAHEINNTVNFISSATPALKKSIYNLKDALESRASGDFGLEKEAGCENGGLKGRSAEAGECEDQLKVVDTLIANISEGARRTMEIIRDLRNFSRVDEAEFKAVDIHEGLDSALTILYHDYKNRIEIIKEYDRSLPRVSCLPGQLNQVFMNILSNAVQAIPEAGEIRIRTWQEEGSLHVAIRDTGTGIPEDILPRIYDPFFTTKEVGRGTGLGLGICHAIIRKHRGEIKVKSEVGKGTEFEVIIPYGMETR